MANPKGVAIQWLLIAQWLLISKFVKHIPYVIAGFVHACHPSFVCSHTVIIAFFAA
jgi:hypothetical protein